MAESHVVSALVDKRAELAGQIVRIEQQLGQFRADLIHIDATIRLFAPTRGLLRLHSRYGLPDCSTAQSGLCHEASARSVAQTNRSSATRSINNSLGGIFLHW